MGQANLKIDIEVTEKGKKAPQYTLISDLDGQQTLADSINFVKQTLIAVAKNALDEELDKGFDKKYVTFVDDKVSKNTQSVNPFGKIEYVARQDLTKILLEIYTLILKRSPVATGYYYFNNLVFVNNREVASNKQELINYFNTNKVFESKDQIRFVNIAPYARKLERHGISNGKSKRKINKKKDRRLLGQGEVYKPNGVYALTAKTMEAKYGKNAFIKFSFLDGGQLDGLSGNNRTYKTDSGVQSRKGQPYFYPSIVVNVIGTAITNSEVNR